LELSDIKGLRRDGFGRLLAPTRASRGSEIVVAGPAGEQMSMDRLRALGVDADANPRGPGAVNQQANDGGEFPKHAGGGFYDLSDNSRVEGKAEAEAAQAKLDSKGS
jgi:hypothetical protein